MTADTNSEGTVSIDRSYHWRPITSETPRGVKLQLIRRQDGVAHYGVIHSNDAHWTHWAPLPTFNKESQL